MKQDGTARQVISAVAVVASLVFIGLEIRQNTAARRSQTRQAIADGSKDQMLRLVEDAQLARAWQGYLFPERLAPPPALTALDTVRVEQAILAVLRHQENVYLQYREGVSDEGILDTYSFVGGVWDAPQFAVFWETSPMRAIFDSSFVRAFNEANGLR